MAVREALALAPDKIAAATLAMLVAQREDRRSDDDAVDRSTETILSTVGLADGEIGVLVGKSANAVKKTRYRDQQRAAKNQTAKAS